jgi:hypothetical protein
VQRTPALHEFHRHEVAAHHEVVYRCNHPAAASSDLCCCINWTGCPCTVPFPTQSPHTSLVSAGMAELVVGLVYGTLAHSTCTLASKCTLTSKCTLACPVWREPEFMAHGNSCISGIGCHQGYRRRVTVAQELQRWTADERAQFRAVVVSGSNRSGVWYGGRTGLWALHAIPADSTLAAEVAALGLLAAVSHTSLGRPALHPASLQGSRGAAAPRSVRFFTGSPCPSACQLEGGAGGGSPPFCPLLLWVNLPFTLPACGGCGGRQPPFCPLLPWVNLPFALPAGVSCRGVCPQSLWVAGGRVLAGLGSSCSSMCLGSWAQAAHPVVFKPRPLSVVFKPRHNDSMLL